MLYEVELVVFDRSGNEAMMRVNAEGRDHKAAIDNATKDAKMLLRDGVLVEVNGYRRLDE